MGWNSQVVIASQVIIEGTEDGVFVYNGTAGPGTLVASLAPPGTVADPYGNTVRGGGLAIYGAGGQDIFLLGPPGTPALIFPSGASFEATAGNVAAGLAGSGLTQTIQLLMSGPKGSAAGATDWVQIQMLSGNKGATGGAAGFLNYIDNAGAPAAALSWGVGGVSIFQGSINSIVPQAGKLASPGPNAGNPPSGSGTASASTVAGALLSYFDALATTYNETATAVRDLVNLLISWGV